MDEIGRRRPGPVRWSWYAFGGRLPARHRGWVLHDLTCRTWAVRHLVRASVQVAPVVAILLLVVPGSWAIRIAAVTAGLLLGLLYSCAYMDEIAEHRVAQAGYPVGTARQVRDESHAEERAADRERYNRTWRAGRPLPGPSLSPGALPAAPGERTPRPPD